MKALRITLISIGVFFAVLMLPNIIMGRIWPMGIVLSILFLIIGFSIQPKKA